MDAARQHRRGQARQEDFDPVARWVEEQLAGGIGEALETVRAGLAAQAPDALPWYGWVSRSVASTNAYDLNDGRGDRYVFLAGFPVYFRHPDQQDESFLFVDRLACAEAIAREYKAALGLDADVELHMGSNPVAFNELQHLTPLDIRDMLEGLLHGQDQMDPLALDGASSEEDLFVSTAWPLIFSVSSHGHEEFLRKCAAIGRRPALSNFAAGAAALIESEMASQFDTEVSVTVYPAVLWRDLPTTVRMLGLSEALQGMIGKHPEAQGLKAKVARGWLTVSLVNAQGRDLISTQHRMPDEPPEKVVSSIRNIAESLKLTLTLED